MAVDKRILEYLDDNDVDYEVYSHPKVYRTVEEARELGVDVDEIAKCLVVTSHGDRSLIVVPGGHRISNDKIRDATGNKHSRLETEDEMSEEFFNWELGAIPPLGDIFDVPVYVDKSLIGHETVLFTAGSHTDSIKMNTADFINLIRPDIVDLSEEEDQRWSA